ncbi:MULTISPECIES: 23S rRNA (uracil(1939)-C(5))-methyltransferase RlmD [unclassified Sedimentibacter]|uniref:23S rRNA (uracil(1939)-C(5))-methyltransferase RlmD n=1 Tax=unclassified Sedimentibacter TaxID=2649220 RepID=UPI0027E1A257|nr:23S rRNA (uracil(1939)-C(5))-methyltransferase RlmD [Sedimentibacter sp. MB35-C1]WMJ77559.1 23S rRNA (uracil(1939)-C(5))-methyltransferase RlmD [Sedimentibacter sp. MB35-C1]
MKKNDIIEVTIDEINFPNVGTAVYQGKKIKIKNTLPGQKVKARISRTRKERAEAKVVEVIEPACFETDSGCSHFTLCGGCSYQTVPYEKQLEIKSSQVKTILDRVLTDNYEFLPIVQSPKKTEYRNKMEFSFGDEVKEGPLTLGMHRRNSFHSIVNTSGCSIVDEDFRQILCQILGYFQGNSQTFYHKSTNIGFLRYLLVRKAERTGQILINLITTSQSSLNEKEFVDLILNINLEGTIKCIAHSIFDGVADVARADEMKILYGEDKIVEELLGLHFNISSFSFFQTNSLGAEKLYSIVRDFIGTTKDKTIFDLYSGTGTIGQILAPTAKKVIGIEIVEEAVEKANENAKLNNLNNCTFIAGDVLKKIDELDDKPDIIVLDPPREGIHPKAIQKIIDYKPETFIYISCKPTSLEKDLPYFLDSGYKVEKAQCVDMFPMTPHVETVILMTRCGENDK